MSLGQGALRFRDMLGLGLCASGFRFLAGGSYGDM